MKKILCIATVILLMFSICIAKPDTALVSADTIDINAKSYILLEKESGMVLAKQNEHDKRPVASICKLMTSLLVMEKLDNNELSLDDKFTASEYACSMEGSQAFLDAGSSYTVRDLLKSVIVASANDSSVVLAEGISGSEQNFVKMMNKRATELGMNDTVYENSNGLPTINQHSSAYDCALLLREVAKHDLYIEDSKIWMDTLVHPSGRETELVNTNRLVKYYNKCTTGKTGFTDEAGYCLCSSACDQDFELICTVLGCENAKDRFEESVKLFNYGFSNFENKTLVNKGDVVGVVKVSNGKEESVELCANESFVSVLPKNSDEEITIELKIPDKVYAPIKSSDEIGKIYVLQNGVVLDEISVSSCKDIDKQQVFDIVQKIGRDWGLKNGL